MNEQRIREIVKQCCDIVHDKTDDSIRVVHAIEVTFGLD